ncbi:MAG: hypothetical protein DI539_31530 [Flavobacterium psychrophilum]|nr:MAG: hypothetical protein DI539_31530 [Flavobacterium psychrophilum]
MVVAMSMKFVAVRKHIATSVLSWEIFKLWPTIPGTKTNVILIAAGAVYGIDGSSPKRKVCSVRCGLLSRNETDFYIAPAFDAMDD